MSGRTNSDVVIVRFETSANIRIGEVAAGVEKRLHKYGSGVIGERVIGELHSPGKFAKDQRPCRCLQRRCRHNDRVVNGGIRLVR